MLYTHITQLVTHTTNAYIAAAYLAIMLLSLLRRVIIYIYHLERAKVDAFSLRRNCGKISDLISHFFILNM